MTAIRIQRYLSEQGIASRREAEAWVLSGYIKINGTTVTVPGTKFDPDLDQIEIAPAAKNRKKHYFLYNKPKGIVTVGAQAGEQEIKNIIKLPPGVVPVGRLDKETGGLIFLTDDGVVARRIMDPQFAHEKEYEVSLYRAISDEALDELEQGIFILGQYTRPAIAKRLSGYKISLTIREGKNRQVRRMLETVGSPVKNLIRRRIMSFELGHLAPGNLKELSAKETQKLYAELQLI